MNNTDNEDLRQDPHIGHFSSEEIEQLKKEYAKPKRKSLFEF